MTLQELCQYKSLLREIETLQDELETLQASADIQSPVVNGMPHQSGISDKTGEYASLIADLSLLIEQNISKYQRLRLDIEKYIKDVPDSETRLLLRLRFIDGAGFRKIAEELEISVQTAFARYQKYILKAGL